jgi:hypothetical protein
MSSNDDKSSDRHRQRPNDYNKLVIDRQSIKEIHDITIKGMSEVHEISSNAYERLSERLSSSSSRSASSSLP